MSRYWDLTGDEPALRGHGYRVTRARLRVLIDEAKRVMRRSGVGPSSTLIVRLPASASFVAHLLAAWELRVCVGIIDHRAPSETCADLDAFATHEVSVVGSRASVTTLDPTTSRRPVPAGTFAILQFSSGTTAAPKLVVRTEEAIVAELDRYERFGAAVDAARQSIVLASSVAHSWALFAGLLLSLRAHREVVFPAGSNAGELGRALSTAPFPSVLLGTPPHLAALRSLKTVPRGLGRVLIAGAQLGEAETRSFVAAFPSVQVGQVYGMTETGVIAADWTGEHPGSVGRIADDLVPRVDSAGQLSLLLPSSPYLDHARAQRESTPYLLETGDIVDLDSEGCLRVEGRASGYVTFRGIPFHSTTLERHLAAHLAGRGDAIAVVADERIEVYVEGGQQALHAVAAGVGSLPPEMSPDAVHLVSGIPRTPAGKALRRRELLQELVIG
jgi:acyl-coenzyme A synthetase/AMP-(fatty) acid ligase